MELTSKQYETAVNNVAEISQVLLDMEGGKYVLAMFSELVQELLNERNLSGAALAVQKLYEAAEVPIARGSLDKNNAEAWITLFAEVLNDILEKSIF